MKWIIIQMKFLGFKFKLLNVNGKKIYDFSVELRTFFWLFVFIFIT